jgi:hypothetical protein
MRNVVRVVVGDVTQEFALIAGPEDLIVVEIETGEIVDRFRSPWSTLQ